MNLYKNYSTKNKTTMLPLRCLEGRPPRSTHCRMRRSPKKTKSTPTRLKGPNG